MPICHQEIFLQQNEGITSLTFEGMKEGVIIFVLKFIAHYESSKGIE